MTLEQKIRMAMAYAGISSQRVLADAVGISPQNFSKKLKRGSFADAELEKMASVMGGQYYAGFKFSRGMYTTHIPPEEEDIKDDTEIIQKALRYRAIKELIEEKDAKEEHLFDDHNDWYESDEYKAQSAAESAAWEAKVQERMKKLKK